VFPKTQLLVEPVLLLTLMACMELPLLLKPTLPLPLHSLLPHLAQESHLTLTVFLKTLPSQVLVSLLT
jgi:hypothetical protein